MMLRTLCLVLTACSFPALALGDDLLRLSQYGHSAWRIQDGALSGEPRAITQTSDGYLWIATSTGLLRFDGVRLIPFTPSDTSTPAPTNVFALHGGSDGSLWIGAGVLMKLKDGTLTRYPEKRGRVNAIIEDRQGSIWFARSRVGDLTGPVCQVAGDQVRCYAADAGMALPTAVSLIRAADDTLWVGNAGGLTNWRPGSPGTTFRPGGLQAGASLSGVTALAARPDGSVWIGMSRTGPGLGLQQIKQGGWKPLDVPGFDGSSVSVTALFTDRQKAVWIGTEGQGLYRVADGKVDRFHKADGLSGDSVTGFYEDREGNMWVATSEGLDCFRKTRMTTFSTREGLKANAAGAVLAARDGTIWISNTGALESLTGDRVVSITKKDGLPGDLVTALLQDHSDRLWVGVDDGLFLYERGRFRPITRADGTSLGTVVTMTEDRANNIWAEVVGNPRRLVRITDLQVREDISAPQLPGASALAADPEDGIWMGLQTGDVARYRKGKLETFRLPGRDANVRQVIATSDGSVWALNAGIIRLRNGITRALTVENGLPCAGAQSFIFDAQGALWLYAPCGLLSIAATELQKWWEHEGAKLEVQVLDAMDGVRPAASSFEPHASRAPDGRLWFANESVIQVIDPIDRGGNTIPPPVYVEAVTADRVSYGPTGVVRLPPLIRDLQIDFTGLSFVVPQKVLFRYRLEGRDDDWQESGTRRQAFYSDLHPGSYRFRVIARNNDGLWNEQGAALEIIVAPAWYQTGWFLALSITIGVLIVWAAYLLRIRQVARALSARFDERLTERTRMARELHDTVLQTVQGSKMVADNALSLPDDGSDMRRAMAQLSTWLGQASIEGRAAVNALRDSTMESNDLSEAFRVAIEDCRRHGAMQPSLSVIGLPREMHSAARDDVYRITYEAIRNACAHSGGSRVAVELTYGRCLTVSVSDDGVGIDPAVATLGRERHFGLQGMRERANRIGATLDIVSSPEGGTKLTIVVPGRLIFLGAATSLVDRVRSRFRA